MKPADSIAGWYGKLPCLGDFASRRLPGEFIATWDAWLQHSILASREQLGSRWLDTFLKSPMWRFAIGRDVCGPAACIGLLVPSVDKIGRYFPLTFAMPLRDPGVTLACVFGSYTWYAELEHIALAALSTDFSVEALENTLAENAFSPERVKHSLSPELAAWLAAPGATPFECRFNAVDALSPATRDSADVLRLSQLDARSVWWCVEHLSGPTELHCVHRLPDGDRYTRMLRAAQSTVNAQPLQ